MIDVASRGRVLALLPPPGPVEDDEVEVRALIYALEEFRRYNKNQLRIPEGFEGGGRFRSLATQLIRLLKDWSDGKGEDDPLDKFTDDQLRKVAAAQGLVGKGERLGPNRRNVLKKRLYEAAIGGKKGDAGGPEKPDADKPDKPAPKKAVPAKRAAPPSPSTVRQRLLDLKTNDERREYLESLNLNQTQARQLAKGLSVRQSREGLDSQLDLIVKNFDTTPTHHESYGYADSPEPKAPSSQALPAKRAPAKAAPKPEVLSDDPAVREVQVENRIRAAYAKLRANPPKDADGLRAGATGYVGIADLREELGETLSRHDVDEALVRMSRQSGVDVAPEENQKILRDPDREAAVEIGGRANHAVKIDDPSPRPLPGAAPDVPDKPQTGGDELDGMTKAKLLATHGGKGSRIHSGMSKPEMIAAIRQWRAGEPERAAKRAVNARENEPYIRYLEGVRGQLPDRNYGRAVDEILEKMRSGEYDRWDAYNHAGTSKVMTGPGANSPETIQGRRVMDDFRRLVAASEDTDEPLGGTIKGEPTTAEQLAKKSAVEAEVPEADVKHTVADLRLIAKQRGVKIPAGTKKAELLALLGLTRSDITDWEERMADEPVEDTLDVETRDRAIAYLETRIAGKDITPGGEQLHHYWTRGKGLAKWLGHPHEWTALYHHLLKYAPTPEAAKRWASAWFHEVKGFYSGSDLHRVEHGKPPRGKRIGPG